MLSSTARVRETVELKLVVAWLHPQSNNTWWLLVDKKLEHTDNLALSCRKFPIIFNIDVVIIEQRRGDWTGRGGIKKE